MQLIKEFHLAHPLWLFALAIIPIVFALFFFFQKKQNSSSSIESFVDRHLLPYLLVHKPYTKSPIFKTLLMWSSVWAFFTLAMAGPRWNYREIETFSKDQSLVVLLDLSESMNASDLKPSRLVRAKQKIEDLLHSSQGVKMGLIAFAADPHMIAPITDDKEMIKHLLPSLETDLVYVQGSKLVPALTMAASMLESEPGSNKALLVISDGGFEDAAAINAAKKLSDEGLVIHTMGVGTLEGAPLKDMKGNVVKKNGLPILSRLEQERLQALSDAGKGYYLEAHYSDQGDLLILKDLEKRATAQENIKAKSKLWDERFYLLLLPALPIVLFWFRRGYVFSLLPIFFLSVSHLEGAQIKDAFKNADERGKEAIESGQYETALQAFQDPYRKGVAHYRAGQFAEAEEMFKSSKREEVAMSAAYNLGNALAKQQKFKEAIKAYERVLGEWPECTKAKDNLELVKNLLQEQQSQDGDSEGSDQDKEGSDKSKEQEGESKKSEDSDSEDEEQKESESKDSQGQDSQKQDVQEQESEKQTPEQQAAQGKDSQESQPQEQDPQEQAAAPNPEEDKKEEMQNCASQEELDADLWLNQISGDPKAFLKNKFYIESKKNGTTQGVDPW